MSETVFKKVDYTLKDLVGYVDIGLPGIQRPFVWMNAKVRDLFDSMYRGYPVGYLLLWQNTLTEDIRIIGRETKQKAPAPDRGRAAAADLPLCGGKGWESTLEACDTLAKWFTHPACSG